MSFMLASTREGPSAAAFQPDDLVAAARRVREPCFVVKDGRGARGVLFGGELLPAAVGPLEVLAVLPPQFPEWLGDRSFAEAHGCIFPYVVGEMANGIATAEMVIAAHAHGLLGFFGAAGLPPQRVSAAIDTIEAALGQSRAWGSNLIHSPHEPDIEAAVTDLYIRRGVERVSASAYMDLTPMIVRFAAHGLQKGTDGRTVRRTHVFAKISRPEVARAFLQPMPRAILDDLVRQGQLTQQEAELACRLPVATDITVEADSGGHTDNQALPAVFPTVLQQTQAAVRAHGYVDAIRVGAAGGIGTPASAAAAFAMGAAYVLTGSVNQSAVEAGLSARGKELLAQCQLGDVMMAPAADMFEMGVKVQVLKRGTLFAVRAHKLYDVYKQAASLDDIAPAERERLERDIFKRPLSDVWEATRAFFAERNPAELAKAEASPKHKMALVFRSYLGQASKWAIAGDSARALDFQIWSGPALGAFNAWVKGSALEPLANRTVGQIGLNILEGAAVFLRATQLRAAGLPMPEDAFAFAPRPLRLGHRTQPAVSTSFTPPPAPRADPHHDARAQ